MKHVYYCSSMQPQLLDNWIASLPKHTASERSPQSSISPATEFEQSEMFKDQMLGYSIFGDASRKVTPETQQAVSTQR
jgi:hypothetical protein